MVLKDPSPSLTRLESHAVQHGLTRPLMLPQQSLSTRSRHRQAVRQIRNQLIFGLLEILRPQQAAIGKPQLENLYSDAIYQYTYDSDKSRRMRVIISLIHFLAKQLSYGEIIIKFLDYVLSYTFLKIS